MQPGVSQDPSRSWLQAMPGLRGTAEGRIDAEGQSCRASGVPIDEGRGAPGCSTRAGDHGLPVQRLGRGASGGGDEWRNADVRAGGLEGRASTLVPSAYGAGDSLSDSGWTATRYGWDGPNVWAVAACESSGRPDAVSPDGQNWGLMQLGVIHKARAERLGFTWEQMLQPRPNLLVAYDLWLDQGWAPWACRYVLEVIQP